MSDKAHIIIDGYNFILRTGHVDQQNINALESARHELITKLSSYKASKQVKITVVFDGQAEYFDQHTSSPSGINVVFSNPPQNADRVIVNMIENASLTGNITIVSSDNFIRTSAGSLGCQILTSGEFAQKLIQKPANDYSEKYSKNMSQIELDEWMKIFKDDGKKEK